MKSSTDLKDSISKYELSDEELDKVTGGTEPYKKHEIELGEFVPDAYKPASKDKDPNNIDLVRPNNLNQRIDVEVNYDTLEYKAK